MEFAEFLIALILVLIFLCAIPVIVVMLILGADASNGDGLIVWVLTVIAEVFIGYFIAWGMGDSNA